ncbi:MAG: MBL fold metallo-hydrolase, partial [Chitinophagaceae bacterium]|nr:MBL fold metallo-hydrolase [Chitinophagaceae bacterium]
FMLSSKEMFAMFSDPAYKITMLTKDLGIFTEKGGTIAFLLSNDGIVVVDSEFPEQATHLIDDLKTRSSKPYKLLINTHHHGDHTSGNIVFKDLVPHVLAHANSKINQQQVAIKNKTEEKQLYPDLTFTDTWCNDFNKEKICLYYYGAGHTNGDSLIHFQNANIVHMGDLVFNRRHPFVDRSAGANIKSWMSVLDKAEGKFDKSTRFIFGHAAEGYDVTGSKEDLKSFRNYLEQLITFAEVEVKAGKTKEEFIANKSIPGNTEWKGDGIERPLTAAYEEVTMK